MLHYISKYFAFKVSWDTQHVMVTCVMTDMWLVLTKITSFSMQQIILNLLKSSFEIYIQNHYELFKAFQFFMSNRCA